MLAEKNTLLLSEDKIVIRRPGRTRKKGIIVRVKVKVITIIIIVIVFVNIDCFIILTYPINPIFIF